MKWDKILEILKVPKLIQEETENQNRLYQVRIMNWLLKVSTKRKV